MNRVNYPGGAGFRRTGAYARTGPAPASFRTPPFPNRDWRPYCPRYRPPDPPPNFVIGLRSERRRFSRPEVERLISQCTTQPNRYEVFDSGIVAGRLFFEEWSHALDAMVQFWEWRFLGDHDLLPDLSSKMSVASDTVELNERLKVLFVAKIKGLIEGEIVKRWEKKLDNLSNEIRSVSLLLKRNNRIMEFSKLTKERDGLFSERKLIDKRLREFKLGLECIINHLEGKGSKELEDKLCLFQFEDNYNWSRIFQFIMRECRRLDAGLPIYAFRREILDQIRNQQIIVMTGETGSGKSTQLVQFLADSGVFSGGCIVCTQPRKVAAISLADRVGEESRGLHSVNCYRSYSSDQNFNSTVVFMTDNCLLQHCMNNRNLSGISCLVVDEAHERSLNTDLLLALVKKLLLQRLDLRLIIMSATADADQLSRYFFGCGTFKVVGRTFPVDVQYVSYVSEGTSDSLKADSAIVGSYVADVVRKATEIHKEEGDGAILVFLTSQMEVEWACERFCAPHTVVLPLHGKLSIEEQSRVFQNYPGQRKVIFATNVAETSLTIPGVKYVVDSGMAKDSRFEPGSGMNILRVGWISRSSANQRAGRAGRTGPGQCYRLYSLDDFELMPAHQEPEIRRVHLGIAVLKILALGIKNIQEFDFIDAPSPEAIDLAVNNLKQLGAVTLKNGLTELTEEGRYLVKLGIEPRLGKLILGCYRVHLGREGVVLAAVMANSNNIFCRVGDEANKRKSDCFKVPFCHQDGDLFTLLSVYKEWELKNSLKDRNSWCWQNSINAKSMRRCHDVVNELECCLENELSVIIPSYWNWQPDAVTEHDKDLKRVILASLAENVAMYSGYNHLGYQVALTRKYVKLHPSCSLLMFTDKPSWVVFGNILAASSEYLVCVSAFDLESVSTLYPPLLFDLSEMESRKLQARTVLGFSSTVLKRFCGRYNNGLLSLLSRIRTIYLDERISIEVNADNNEIQLFASSRDMEMVTNDVKAALRRERRWLQDECVEKFLYHGGPGASAPVALFGAGAEIKHLELDRRCLTVDIFCSDVSAVNEKELLVCLEKFTSEICAVHKFSKFSSHGVARKDIEKWGSITFRTPEAASMVSKLKDVKIEDLLLKINLSQATFDVDRAPSFPEVKAKVSWPRKFSRGIGIVKCEKDDVHRMVGDFSNLVIGGRYVRCYVSTRYLDSVVIKGIAQEVEENEIMDVLMNSTNLKILSFFLMRGDAVDDPPLDVCEAALFKEISLFMPKRSPQVKCCKVHVFHPNPTAAFMEASVIFDGRLHLEAARALEQIEGKVLPCCRPWQKIRSRRIFHSSVCCSSSIYYVIKEQLNILIANLRSRQGVEITDPDRNNNGSFRVKICANATKCVAEVRQPLEQLMKGKIINASLTPAVLQPLFSKDGIALMKSIQQETGTYILFDRQLLNLRVFGTSEKVAAAEKRLIQCLQDLYENKQMEIRLRGSTLPHDLMKQVVKAFGPDLSGLKEMVPEADVTLNTRRHVILIGGDEESKRKVEEVVYEIARTSGHVSQICDGESTCPICLCEVEDKYQLENCLHFFCRRCLVEQLESAIRNHDSFPIGCAHEGCGAPIWLSDLRSLLSPDKLEELFRASLAAFVASSGGKYRFCSSPDCPSIYRVSTGASGEPFLCGVCYTETCTRCHLEYHPYISCETYSEFKEDPDLSLKEWRKGKDYVKTCPVCGYTIEKLEGCNHIECKCGRHICWFCLDHFHSSDDCYAHLRSIHQGI
ncbi:hypothetical protein Dimus_017797 [Dionaea muscipula]